MAEDGIFKWMCRSVSPVLASALPFAAEGTHSEVFGEDDPEGGTERLARPSLIILLASSSAAPPLGHLHPAAPQLPGAGTCPVLSHPAAPATSSEGHPSFSTCKFTCPQLLFEASPDAYNSQVPRGCLYCPCHSTVATVWLASQGLCLGWSPLEGQAHVSVCLHPE